MKYALIGCGRIATNHIKAALNNKIEIIAVCDIIPEHMEILLAKHGLESNRSIKRYTDYRKLIEENRLDMVSIATDSGVHAEIALYCIEHGLHTIIEKPIAMSMSDADAIVEASLSMNVKVAVCHQNRFNLAIRKTKKAIDDGRFGKMSHGAINVRWNRNEAYYDQAAWRGKWASDGGTLMNQCIHGIDLLIWLMGGKVTSVYGVTRRRFHDYIEGEDIGMAVLTFANGAVATIEGTVNTFPKNLEETLYLSGETGTVKIGGVATNNIDVWNFANEDVEDAANGTLQEVVCNVYGNGHTNLFADFANAIVDNRVPYVSAIDGRNALEIVLAIYKSQLTGQAVNLPMNDFASIEMNNYFGEHSYE